MSDRWTEYGVQYPHCACCQYPLAHDQQPCPRCGERAIAYTKADQRKYDTLRLADEGKEPGQARYV